MIASVYPVFNASRRNYDAAYERWLNWTPVVERPPYRALARNLMYDHRVTPEREAPFHRWVRKSASLEAALRGYFDQCVRHRTRPDFLMATRNASNFVSGAPGADLVDPDTDLLTFLDLNGLRDIFDWASRNPAPEYKRVFKDYPKDCEPSRVGSWIEEQIKRLGASTVVPAALSARRAARAHPSYQRHHPVWAMLWDDAEAVVRSADADRWSEIVGVHRGHPGNWVIPLQYKVVECGTLVRPTMLDAGCYAYHFPSPPAAPIRDGGCCMDLRTSPAPGGLRHEYIVQEMDFFEDHWRRAGPLCVRTKRPTRGSLELQRRAHHKRLCANYPGVRSWMKDCT